MTSSSQVHSSRISDSDMARSCILTLMPRILAEATDNASRHGTGPFASVSLSVSFSPVRADAMQLRGKTASDGGGQKRGAGDQPQVA